MKSAGATKNVESILNKSLHKLYTAENSHIYALLSECPSLVFLVFERNYILKLSLIALAAFTV
jgi:hypothetical protein